MVLPCHLCARACLCVRVRPSVLAYMYMCVRVRACVGKEPQERAKDPRGDGAPRLTKTAASRPRDDATCCPAPVPGGGGGSPGM